MRGGPYAAIALAVVSVSFSAIFISWSTSPFITIALYRLAIASLILAPFALFDRRRPLRGIPRRFVLRERLNAWMALGIGLGFSGVVVIAIADSTARSASLIGDLLAFAGGIGAGFYFLAGRRLRQRIPLLAYAFVVYVSATAFLFVFALGLRESLVPVGDWRTEMALFLAMAVIPQIGGHTLYNWSLRWVTAPVVSLSLVGEPIGSSLLAWVLLTQVPTVGVAVGAGLALVGIYLTAFGQSSHAPEILTTRDVE